MVPRSRPTSAARSPTIARAALRGGRRARAHHVKVGNIPGTPATSTGSPSGSPSCARTRRTAPTRRSSTSSCRSTSMSRTSTRRWRWSRARRGQRRPGDRRVAHEQARDPARDLRRIPLRYLSWVELNDGRLPGHARSRRRDREPPPAARRGRVRRARIRGRLPPGRVCGPVGSRGAVRGAAQLPMEEIFSRAYLTTAPARTALTRSRS